MLRLAAINQAVYTYLIVSQTPIYCHVQSTYLTVARCSSYIEFYAVRARAPLLRHQPSA